MRERYLQGKPPEGHDRQCHTYIKKKRRRCQRWAITGSDHCQFHGGHRAQSAVSRTRLLPVFYKYNLCKTLEEAVQEATGVDPSEQLGLFEELALMRVAANEAVQLYGIAMMVQASDETPQAKVDQLRINAAELMKGALREVANMCEAAARVNGVSADKFSIHNLNYVVHQMVSIAYDVFGPEHEDLAQAFEERLQKHVKLAKQTGGTQITPDADVILMDETIPKE